MSAMLLSRQSATGTSKPPRPFRRSPAAARCAVRIWSVLRSWSGSFGPLRNSFGLGIIRGRTKT